MTLRNAMRSGLRAVVDALGKAWSYRVVTSAPGAWPVTWSAWTPMTAHQVSRGIVLEHDAAFDETWAHERGVIRISDVLTLGAYHQVKDPDGVVFALGGAVGETILVSANVGTATYRITRLMVDLVGAAARGEAGTQAFPYDADVPYDAAIAYDVEVY